MHPYYAAKASFKQTTIPAKSLGTLNFLTSHQCIMLFYIPNQCCLLVKKHCHFSSTLLWGTGGVGYKERLIWLLVPFAWKEIFVSFHLGWNCSFSDVRGVVSQIFFAWIVVTRIILLVDVCLFV